MYSFHFHAFARLFESLALFFSLDRSPERLRSELFEAWPRDLEASPWAWQEILLHLAPHSGLSFQPLSFSLSTHAEASDATFPCITFLPASPEAPSSSPRSKPTFLGLLQRKRGRFLVTSFSEAPPVWLTAQETESLFLLSSTPLLWYLPSLQAPLESFALSKKPEPLVNPGSKVLLGRLLAFLSVERRDLVVIFLYSIAIGLLSLTTPVAVQALVNTVAFGTLFQPILLLTLMLAAGLAFSAFLQILQILIVEILVQRLFLRITSDFSWRFPRWIQAVRDHQHPSLKANYFFEAVTLQKSVAPILFEGSTSLLQISLGLLLLAFYHPYLLVFGFLLLLVIVFLVFVLGRGAVKSSVKTSKAKHAVASWLEDLALHPTLFSSAEGREFAALHTDSLARDYFFARKKHFSILLRQMAASLLTQVLASTALLLVGGWLVIQRELTLGQLVAAELVVATVVASIAKLTKLFEKYYDLMASLEKIGQIVDLPCEELGGIALPSRTEPARLRFRHLSLSFAGRSLFSEISNDILPGQIIGITGAPGTGKSAFFDLLWGRRSPDQGQILLDEYDLRELRLDEMRQDILLLRDPEFLEASVFTNLQAGRFHLTHLDARRALEKVGLGSLLADLPKGLDTELSRSAWPLSSQQASLLLLARAIAAKPRLLLLDGLLDGLCVESRKIALQALLSPETPWTLLIISHHEEILRACDAVWHFPLPPSPAVSEASLSPPDYTSLFQSRS